MVENITGGNPKNEPVKIDTSTPLVIKDVEGATRWTKFTKSFTEQGKLQRDLEKSKLASAKKNVESQEKITKDLRKQQEEMNKSVDSLKKSIDDKDEATYLKEIIAAHGRNSKQAKDTQKSIEAGNLDYSKGSATIQTLQKKSAKLDSDAIASDSKQETYEKTLNTEKAREGGIGQKMLIKTLEKGQKWTKGMYESSMKVAKTGLKGAFIALGLMALLKFLDSDTWKGITKSIAKWVEGGGIVQIKGMLTSIYNYFFGKDSIFTKLGAIFDSFFGEEEYDDFGVKTKDEGSMMKGFAHIFKEWKALGILATGLAAVFLIPAALTLVGFGLAWKLAMSPFKLVKGLIKGIGATAMAAYGAARRLMGDVKDPKTGKWGKKVVDDVGKVKAGTSGAPPGRDPKTGRFVSSKGPPATKVGGKADKAIKNVGKSISKSGVGKATKGAVAKMVAKFPKLFKAIGFLSKIPGIGKALAIAPILAAVAMGKSAEQIAPLVGAMLGGVLGWSGGAFLGGMVGAAGGPLALVTGALGGIAGGLLGDSLGTSLSQWMLGLEATGMPWPLGSIDNLLNDGKFSGGSAVSPIKGKDGGSVSPASPPKGAMGNVRGNVTGQDIEEAEVDASSQRGQRGMGGRGAVMNQTTVAPVTNKVSNTQIVGESAKSPDPRINYYLNGGLLPTGG